MNQQQPINFCKAGRMSTCSADDLKQQPVCNFYEKSQNANRCMYFIFGEYCDCLKAQMHSEQGIQK